MGETLVYGIVGLPDNLDPHNQAVPNDFATRIAFEMRQCGKSPRSHSL